MFLAQSEITRGQMFLGYSGITRSPVIHISKEGCALGCYRVLQRLQAAPLLASRVTPPRCYRVLQRVLHENSYQLERCFFRSIVCYFFGNAFFDSI